jgi:HTH-type transcriptional regulator/antitoxin HigA
MVDIRPIRNDDDHREALAENDRLWKSPPNTPDGDKLDVLVTLVEAYEAKRWPLDPVSPRDILE